MKLSRKEFLKKGLFSLGELLCTAAGVRNAQEIVEPEVRHGLEPEQSAGTGCRAVARSERCLAGNCGCFACVEHCESRAITAIAGKGIMIDSALCTGCGACNTVCPVLPKAVLIVPRER